MSRGEFYYNGDLTSRSARAEDMKDECMEDIESKGNRSEFVLPLVRLLPSVLYPSLDRKNHTGQGNKAPLS